jgi:CheY-like chemotaxis protein
MAGEVILIVEDHPLNLKLAEIVLAETGYDVRTAVDAKEAFTRIQESQPRLILMDIQLPDMDGLEATRRLKADPATRGIIVIALTAYAMKGDKEKMLAAGCDGYVSKPIDTRALPGVIAGYLASTHLGWDE